MSSPNQQMLLMQPPSLQQPQQQALLPQMPTQLSVGGNNYIGQSPTQATNASTSDDSDDTLNDPNVSYANFHILRND